MGELSGARGELVGQGVARIVLQDPAGRNALTAPMREAVAEQLRRFYDMREVRAIVIGAEGRNFSVGGDLGQIADHAGGQAAFQLMRSVGELPLLLDASPKPLIAAVHGHCIGAGAGLALLCDHIVAGKTASIGFPFLKVGVVPDFGVTYTLPRRVGPSIARRALIGARTFASPEALDAGLVDEVVEDDEVWERSLAYAGDLAQAPVRALHQLRLMLKEAPSTLSSALQAEALNQAICFGSDALREGIAAFKEKRSPDFVRAEAAAAGRPDEQRREPS